MLQNMSSDNMVKTQCTDHVSVGKWNNDLLPYTHEVEKGILENINMYHDMDICITITTLTVR
jgi:hypothetical protein